MFVVTLPQTAAVDPTSFAERAKDAGVDLLEIRGDLTPNVLAFESPLPIIIAPRYKGNALLQRFKPTYIDLEQGEDMELPADVELISSFHNYNKTPSVQELLSLIEQCRNEGADVIKIATTIQSYADIQTLSDIYEVLPRDEKLVILGMGRKAYCNRIFSPFRNYLTYTYLDDGEEIIRGQIPLAVHKLTAHCNKPQVFGLLGSLNTQSLSPLIHNTLFEQNDIDALYTLFLTDDLDDAYDSLKAQGVAGFSVTSPFKQSIIPKLDRVDEGVEKLGTVNTVVREGAEYVGYARDTHGLFEGYPFLKESHSVAILGSGGVVPSVIETCQLSGIKDIRLFARNKKARESLASTFDIQSSDLSGISSSKPDVIINAISGNTALQLPKAKEGAHAIDLRYGCVTEFQAEAKKAGYTIYDGLPMLLHQAIAQFRLFTGKEPTSQSIKEITSSILHHGKQ
ncbi:MAG: type I 3-dehydroquinate dehydratase [bacterium]|nr:type I 3-dehydroquinate dehydratase [bacterium]